MSNTKSTFTYPVLNTEATGARIRELRMLNGIKVREIEEKCFLTSPRVIYKWESGVCLPTVENLLVLSRMFGVSIEDILVDTNAMVPFREREQNDISSDDGRRNDSDRPLFLRRSISSQPLVCILCSTKAKTAAAPFLRQGHSPSSNRIPSVAASFISAFSLSCNFTTRVKFSVTSASSGRRNPCVMQPGKEKAFSVPCTSK